MGEADAIPGLQDTYKRGGVDKTLTRGVGQPPGGGGVGSIEGIERRKVIALPLHIATVLRPCHALLVAQTHRRRRGRRGGVSVMKMLMRSLLSSVGVVVVTTVAVVLLTTRIAVAVVVVVVTSQNGRVRSLVAC